MDIVRRLLAEAPPSGGCGLVYGDMLREAAEEIKGLRAIRDGCERMLSERKLENERLRAALTEISMMRAEDMYRGDDDNAAAFIARAALAPPPQR